MASGTRVQPELMPLDNHGFWYQSVTELMPLDNHGFWYQSVTELMPLE